MKLIVTYTRLTILSLSRGGASGNKLKMTLGLPVYVKQREPCPLDLAAAPCSKISSLHTIANAEISQRRGDELLRQFRRAKSLHHLRQGHRGSTQSSPRRGRGRYGHGNGQEGKARVEEKGHAGCRGSAE